jgi:hypothetical protein
MHGALTVRVVTGTIQFNHKTLFDNVEFWIEETAAGRPEECSWYGFFDLPEDATVALGGPYEVELEDSRSGEFIVVDLLWDYPVTAIFKGSGELEIIN